MSVKERLDPLIAGLQGLAFGLFLGASAALWSNMLAVAAIGFGILLVVVTYGIERQARKLSKES